MAASALVRTYVPPDWQPVALSPDGTQLAYAYGVQRGREDVRQVDSGVRVVDLSADLAGRAGTYRLTDGHWTEAGTELAARRLARELSVGD